MNKGPGEQRKAMDVSSPAFWLRSHFATDKTIDDLVKQRIAKIYRKVPRYGLDDEASQRWAMKVTCLINIARVEHSLAKIGPLHRSYLSLSKSAATWLALLAKFNKPNGKGPAAAPARRKMPTTASSQEADEPDDEEGGDADGTED